ncbi:MAG TPA: adenylate/guanylate cyclase domain-containing protein [Usitatibacter sp.]|nr:adenylate/guanylate cyclase domain-containing protein [Usitatibacter sp.]
MIGAPAPGGSGRLQNRIVLFFVALLMAVQLVSYLLIRYAIDQTAQNTLREELRVGSRTFQRLLQQRSQSLVEATVVLTADFGFRAAVASRDRPTILSALGNHSARINATGVALLDLDGTIVADTINAANEGKPFPEPRLVQLASSVGRASGMRIVDGRPFQSVIVPVLAPEPIAWVSMDFVVDDVTARDLKNLSAADVSFIHIADDRTDVLATTLPKTRRGDLAPRSRLIVAQGQDGIRVQMGGEDYEAIATILEGGSGRGIYTILQRSVAEGLLPYRALEAALLVIAGLSLALTLVGSVRVARRITRPLSQLSEAVRAIERGDYNVRVGTHTGDEIGALATAFDGMARGLAERDRMRDVLGKVASSEVVRQLMESRIELGGAEVEATVMFTDMRNFTAIAESLTPQQSLQLLNRVLTEVSAVIEGHGGVVDKYMGDGAMAVFGAPVTREDDVQRAVVAALGIRDRVRELAPELAELGMPRAQVGIGVNTARMVAGNIGSPSRLNYTVLGDGVNLASRLEGLTKRYHVPIVCGSRTREGSRGIVWRELDKVRVRGKKVAERIFEPMGYEGSLTLKETATLAQWHGALEFFRERQWSRSRVLFERLAEEPAYERLVSLYLGYLRDVEKHPPGEDWDAAFTLYEK